MKKELAISIASLVIIAGLIAGYFTIGGKINKSSTNVSDGSNLQEQTVNAKKVEGGIASGSGEAIVAQNSTVKQLKVLADRIDSIDQSTNTDNRDQTNASNAIDNVSGDSIKKGLDFKDVEQVRVELTRSIEVVQASSTSSIEDTKKALVTQVSRLDDVQANLKRTITSVELSGSAKRAELGNQLSSALTSTKTNLQSLIAATSTDLTSKVALANKAITDTKASLDLAVAQEVLDRTKDTNSIKSDLATAVTNVNVARAALEASLSDSIDKEKALRGSEDERLKEELTENLKTAQTTLNGLLDAEIATRINETTLLTDKIALNKAVSEQSITDVLSRIDVEKAAMLATIDQNLATVTSQIATEKAERLADIATERAERIAADILSLDAVTSLDNRITALEQFPHMSIVSCPQGFAWVGNDPQYSVDITERFIRYTEDVDKLGQVFEDTTDVNGLNLLGSVLDTNGNVGANSYVINTANALIDGRGYGLGNLKQKDIISSDTETAPKHVFMTLCVKI